MNIEHDRKRLLQEHHIKKFCLDTYQATDMLTIYHFEKIGEQDIAIYPTLAPINDIPQLLNNTGWDMSHGGGLPCSISQFNSPAEYSRFGNIKGLEPIILIRDFSEIYNKYIELTEEFRVFHNLYTSDNKTFIKIDLAGNETIVCKIEEKTVKVRVLELRQFLAIKEMCLLLQFDCFEKSTFSLQDLSLLSAIKDIVKTNEYCYSLDFQEIDYIEKSTNSLLTGKRIVFPLDKKKSGFDGFAENIKNFEEFIIGIDENGDDILSTCDEQKLNNLFDTRPNNPQFLTPVYFNKEVLDKYHHNSKYSVRDSRIFCKSLWSLQIDNHHSDKVCVWLGDLGRLEHSEQVYWKSYNIVPNGSISLTYFRRQLMAEFTDSEQPDHNFRYLYNDVIKLYNRTNNFPIFLELHADDIYCLNSLHIPTANNQSSFDNEIESLTKIIIDSINVSLLKPKLTPPHNKGSINILNDFLAARFSEKNTFIEHIEFLRNLQNIRSSYSAHRKGENYEKLKSKINPQNLTLIELSTKIFLSANKFLEFLIQNVDVISAEV